MSDEREKDEVIKASDDDKKIRKRITARIMNMRIYAMCAVGRKARRAR